MASRLNIYACSGVGDVTKPKIGYDYWVDNTNPITNTQAVNGLLVMINYYKALYEHCITLTDGQVISALNKIDLYSVCLVCAQDYAEDDVLLGRSGRVIGYLLAGGRFNSASLDNDERDEHLDYLIQEVKNKVVGQEDVPENAEFMYWWNKDVVALNKVGLTETEQQKLESAVRGMRGVGGDWKDDESISGYLNNASEYFLYTFFTEAQLKKLPRIIRDKKQQQQYIYNYCLNLFTKLYGTKEMMDFVIRGGIVGYFGVEPEDVCDDIVKGVRVLSSVGQLGIDAIIAIITAVGAIIVPIVKYIVDKVHETNLRKMEDIDEAAIDAGNPNPEDLAGVDTSKIKIGKDEKNGDSTSWFSIILVALGAFILLKK